MAIKMRVSFKLGEIEKFSMIPKGARTNALTLVGDEYMLDVRENVDAGKTPDGKALKPYTQEYADLKRRAGRDVSKPDLNLTGVMWRAMVAKLSRNGQTLTVDFPGNHPKTRFRSAKGPERGKKRAASGQSLTVSRKKGSILTSIIAEANDRIRPFIGVSPAGLQRLFKLFVAVVSKAIDKEK
jgi:hypothetical protein